MLVFGGGEEWHVIWGWFVGRSRGTARNTGNKEALQKGTEPVRPVLPAAVFPAFLVKA